MSDDGAVNPASPFAPFILPLCLAIPAAASGLLWPTRLGWVASYHLRSALLLIGLFGGALLARLLLDIVASPWALAWALLPGHALPLLAAMKLTNSFAADEVDGDDLFAQKGHVGTLVGLSVFAAWLAGQVPTADQRVPTPYLLALATVPALVAVLDWRVKAPDRG